jgi:UDP-4-amino-4,6-dideoxy-N-acetyl-beta-L-altrosamine N-acetyltransferase
MLSGITRLMAETDLQAVLEWRNHPDVRRFMHTQHEISPDEHKNWFHSVLGNPNKTLLIYEVANTPLGYANFSAANDGKIATWGFYASPAAPKGTGHSLCSSALKYGFRQLAFHKVYGEVIAYNERSARLHMRLGFTQEGTLRDHHFDGSDYHDVYCFGLLSSEWTDAE